MLNKTDFEKLKIRIFKDKSCQTRIAAVLSALDAKIELNQRLNAELEGLAKLLYDYWFVQYDFPIPPAQAKALGKPSLAGKPYRSSGGPMVFHPQLKREIPKGWEVGTLDNLCHLNAHTWAKSNQPERVSYVDLANTKNGEIFSVQDYQWNDAPSRARRILTPGDSIFGTVRPGNRSFALIPPTDCVLTGSTGFAVLTPRSNIYREFNYLSVISDSNIDRLTTVASGAAYPAVNPEVVTAQVLPLPPEELVTHFHDSVASSFDLIATHRTLSHHLAQLRDWLLPMLMNGQVRVGSSQSKAM
jgi:type I restriction enzyme S subunit